MCEERRIMREVVAESTETIRADLCEVIAESTENILRVVDGKTARLCKTQETLSAKKDAVSK